MNSNETTTEPELWLHRARLELARDFLKLSVNWVGYMCRAVTVGHFPEARRDHDRAHQCADEALRVALPALHARVVINEANMRAEAWVR